MNLSLYSTRNYDNKSPLLMMEKQSQNKPNQTQFIVSLPALSKVEVSNPPALSAVEWVEPIPKGGGTAAFLDRAERIELELRVKINAVEVTRGAV